VFQHDDITELNSTQEVNDSYDDNDEEYILQMTVKG
jgi:hypothetical protein